MNKNDLLNRINEGEGLFQEFKNSVEKIDRTLVAFANSKGGVIYVGIDDRGKKLGIELTNRLKATIESIARNIDPPLIVTCIDLSGAIAVIVKEGEDKPYKCSDGFFMRIGASNQKLTRDEIFDLALKVNRVRYETLQVLDFHYPRDCSKTLIEEFVHRAHLEHAYTSMGEETFLISLGVAEKQKGTMIFNHAGILFFGKAPQRFIPQAKLSYARYQGQSKTNVVDRVIFDGPLAKQLDEVSKKLEFDIPRRYQLLDRSTRKEIPHYPFRALEEAITNALIHRDYSQSGAEIMIDYYADRMEISNPGELLGNLTLSNLGSKALRRNLLIAELMYRIGKGEKLGSGIARMKTLMEEWRLKAPYFAVEGGFFSVTFFGPKGEIQEEKLLMLPPRSREFMESRHKFSEPFSAHSYARVFNITERTAQKDIEILLKEKLITKEGQGKNTRYRFLS